MNSAILFAMVERVLQEREMKMAETRKVALITGSTSGIGLAIAREMARNGCDVMLNGLAGDDEAKSLCEDLRGATGVNVAFCPANLIDPDAVKNLIRDTESQFGRLDILVNNAGMQHVSPVEDFPVEKWNAILALNLSAPFHAIKAAVPGMKARSFGRIINIASAHATTASPFKSAYVSAKHGLLGLTRTVALELATSGITCNCISPAYVWTPLVEKQIPDTMAARGLTREQVIKDVMLHAQPTKAFVTPEQVAAYAWFLVSDAAASITGANACIDGGWTAQ